MRHRRRTRLIIDADKLDAACKGAAIPLGSRRELYEEMEWLERESTLNARLSKRGGWTKAEIEQICNVLSCKAEDILADAASDGTTPVPSNPQGSEASRDLTILDERDMEKIYNEVEPDSFIWIFSADGFLEADEEEGRFFEVVSKALRRGIKISYFFPDLKSASESHRAFAKIIHRFIADREPKIIENVKGYYILAEGGFLYAHSSRFVVFGKSPVEGERVFERVMLFIRSASPRGGHWIEMGDLLRDNFRHRMKRAIDPIEHIPVAVTGKQWHLSSLVQGRYRTSFDNTNERQYAVVRNIVGSDTAVANLAERVSQIVAQRHRRKPALEWLDVGCESGSNTLVAFEKFRGHDLPVSLTAIEPSPQAEPLPLLQHSVFLNGSEWGLEEFLQVAPHDYKYDIITSVHSWYVIDPIYILSLFRLLQRDGVMAFIISPLENNIINKITIVVDAFIREKHRNREISYSMKKIKDDPYRNFGEDILAACRHYFGDDDDAIKVVKRKDAVIATRRLVTAKGALTSEGKAIAEFFTHGLVRLNDEMCSAVAEVINRSNFNGQLPCTEWDIIIDKEKILTRGQERLFGGIAVPAKSPSIVEPPKIEPVVQLTGAAPTASPPSS